MRRLSLRDKGDRVQNMFKKNLCGRKEQRRRRRRTSLFQEKECCFGETSLGGEFYRGAVVVYSQKDPTTFQQQMLNLSNDAINGAADLVPVRTNAQFLYEMFVRTDDVFRRKNAAILNWILRSELRAREPKSDAEMGPTIVPTTTPPRSGPRMIRHVAPNW